VKAKGIKMENQEIICIGCPLGCHVALTVDESKKIIKFEGNECHAGEKYVAEEFKAPIRVFTGTVRTRGCSRPLLSVKTSKPIVKTNILDCGKYFCDIEVEPPIKIGDVVVSNILNTGADLIATSDLDF
jgi:CxxC motif-containing protein